MHHIFDKRPWRYTKVFPEASAEVAGVLVSTGFCQHRNVSFSPRDELLCMFHSGAKQIIADCALGGLLVDHAHVLDTKRIRVGDIL